MYSLVDSCMFPNWGSNPQPWHGRTTLLLTELPAKAYILLITYNDLHQNRKAERKKIFKNFAVFLFMLIAIAKYCLEDCGFTVFGV